MDIIINIIPGNLLIFYIYKITDFHIRKYPIAPAVISLIRFDKLLTFSCISLKTAIVLSDLHLMKSPDTEYYCPLSVPAYTIPFPAA